MCVHALCVLSSLGELEGCYGVMAMSGALKFPARLSEASDAGDKFVRQFYENFDKRRHVRLTKHLLVYTPPHWMLE